MKLLMVSTIIMTSMITTCQHPLMLSLMIMMQTIMISLMTSYMINNSWYSYMLFMIIISGLMIMFIYMTSLTSNKMFKKNMKTQLLMIMLWMILITINKDKMLIEQANNYNEMMNSYKYTMMMSMSKFINFPLSMIMLTLMIYLFISMTSVIKISNKSTGPLRQK
uniref:NADH-ubiquinone oxidoreductase chain 6 n=1 Tax=Mastinocerus sp. MAS01 TaxID=1205632 RepID=A0A0S2MP39_9COLE|nr:NADH deshydrogenase subunit 6 [Mastinocerus sp. MAS01]